MKILAFGASSSRNSINQMLAKHAADVLQEINAATPRPEQVEVDILDLNDYEMPIYSTDRENEGGVPELAQQFFNKIGDADVVIISFAEHNGFYTSAYKNIFDWASRVDQKVFQNKPMVVMSASPGKNGGATVLKAATDSAPFFNANVVASFPVGLFNQVFDKSTGRLIDADLQKTLSDAMQLLHEV